MHQRTFRIFFADMVAFCTVLIILTVETLGELFTLFIVNPINMALILTTIFTRFIHNLTRPRYDYNRPYGLAAHRVFATQELLELIMHFVEEIRQEEEERERMRREYYEEEDDRESWMDRYFDEDHSGRSD
jgi:hypothetical protein